MKTFQPALANSIYIFGQYEKFHGKIGVFQFLLIFNKKNEHQNMGKALVLDLPPLSVEKQRGGGEQDIFSFSLKKKEFQKMLQKC